MDIKPIARGVALGALFLIPFIPLYVANGLFFPFITGKAFLFRVLVEVLFFSWVVLAIADPKYRPKFSWPLVWFGALTLWMAIANSFGVNPLKAFWSNYERMDGWVTLVHAFLLFVCAGSLLVSKELMHRWWKFFLAGAAMVVAYAFFQLFGWATINQGGVRVDSTFGNAAYLAAYMLFVIPVALWQASLSKRVWKHAFVALAALSVVVLYFTATRGALVGFVAAIVAGLVLYVFVGSGRGRKIAGVVLILMAALIGGFIAVRDSAFMQSDPTLARLSSISFKDLAVRSEIWSMAVRGFEDRPVLGWGQEGFNQVFNTYYEPALYEQEPWFDRAHNLYLDWLVAGGIPALAFFLLFLGTVTWIIFRRGETPLERALLTAALVAYAVQGLVVFDNLFTYVAIALLAAFAHTRNARVIPILESVSAPHQAVVGSVVVPVVAAGMLFTLYIVNVPAYAAAHDVVVAMAQKTPAQALAVFERALSHDSFATQEIREQLSAAAVRAASTNAPVADREKFLVRAVEELSKEIERVPRDARLYVMLAQPYRAAGSTDEAVAALHMAQALSPKKQLLLLEEGIVLLTAGRPLEARDVWVKAYELDTSFDSVRVYAAAGEIAAGNTARGKEMLKEKFGTDIVDSEVLSYAYYSAKQFGDLVSLWEMRVEKNPNDVEKRFGLATAYALAGRVYDARTAAEAIRKEFPAQAARVQEFLNALAQGRVS